jgi:hypothetical protein
MDRPVRRAKGMFDKQLLGCLFCQLARFEDFMDLENSLNFHLHT